jgi:hypothetical protein
MSLPFFSTPPSICLSNNRSAVNHSEFIVEAIHDLLIKGLIEECESKPIVVNQAIRISSNKLHSYFTLVFHKCKFTCLQSRINRFFVTIRYRYSQWIDNNRFT